MFGLSKSLSHRSKVLTVFAVFLALYIISSAVSEFLARAQPPFSPTLSSTHTTSSPNALSCNSTTTIDRNTCHLLFCRNCNPTTIGKVDGFQSHGFRGNEVGAKGGSRVELGNQSRNLSEIEEQGGNDGATMQGIGHQPDGGVVGIVGNEGLVRQGQGGVGGGGGGGNVNKVGRNGVGINVSDVSSVNIGGGVVGGGGVSSGGTILFVGDLHWWTTDVDLSKYGLVKEVKFFDEKASRKSKGYY